MDRLRTTAAAVEARLEAEREQLPLWVPVGLIAGIAAWVALPDPASWSAFIAASGGAMLAALAFARGSRVAGAFAWFSLFAMIGCALIWIRAERRLD